jgi:hypothetical protein
VSLAEFKSAIQRGTAEDDADDAELQRALDAATAWIESDAGCGRVFRLSASVDKVYDPCYPRRLDVLDAVTVTAVALDLNSDRTYSQVLDADDWEFYPYIPPTDGTRYQALLTRPLAAYAFQPGVLTKVTGTFGYVVAGDVPVDVKQATILLAARWFRRPEAPFGVVQSVEFGTFGRLPDQDPDIKTLLGPYAAPGRTWVVV